MTTIFRQAWLARRNVRLAAAVALLLGPGALAVVDQPQIDAAERLFTDKKYADAAGAYARLADELGPDQAPLAPKLAFNRGCAQLAAGDVSGAEASFLKVDAATSDLDVRAAARYNLGQIAAKQAEQLAEKQPEQAIDAYRRAERHFRNTLADRPQNTDAAHNVEVVQRAIARLQEQQKQQQQQQKKDEQKQQDKQDQKKQDKDQQQKKDQGKQGNKSDQQQKQDQDQKSGKPDQQKKSDQEQKQKQQQQNADGKDKQQQSDQAEKGGQGEQQQAQQASPGEQREFDRTAAQILDKERQQRERLKQWLRIMRSRAAPVEKDW